MFDKLKAVFSNTSKKTLKTNKQNHLKSGAAAEVRARKHLEERGFDTIDTNVYSRFGEIDIVMIRGDELVFVEVRQRTSMSYGSAAQSVHIYKQRKLINAARYFLQQNPEFNKYYARFDVITIESKQNNLQWHPCAFSLESQSEYQI